MYEKSLRNQQLFPYVIEMLLLERTFSEQEEVRGTDSWSRAEVAPSKKYKVCAQEHN